MIMCAGHRVLAGRISLELDGAWTAELELDAEDAPSGAVTIAADDGLSLSGAIAEPSGAYVGRAHVRVVGGAGKLGTVVAGSYRSAKLRDPLQAIASATGDRLSSTIPAAIMTRELGAWTLGAYPAWRALRELARAAGAHWRYLADGTLWMGTETWPSEKLPATAAIVSRQPREGRIVIAPEAPALLPGVELEGVGRVAGVDHWIDPDRVRTWAWMF